MLQKDLRSSKVPSIFASHLRGNAVHNIIEQIYDLCNYRRKCHPEHKWQHTVRTKPLFIFIIHNHDAIKKPFTLP